MADRQPAVLLIPGHGDGLAADRRGHDGADCLSGIRGLLEEGGIIRRSLQSRSPADMRDFSRFWRLLCCPLAENLPAKTNLRAWTIWAAHFDSLDKLIVQIDSRSR